MTDRRTMIMVRYMLYYGAMLLLGLSMLACVRAQLVTDAAIARKQAQQLKLLTLYSHERIFRQQEKQRLNQVRIWLLEHPKFKPKSYTQASIWQQLTQLANRLHLHYVVNSTDGTLMQKLPQSRAKIYTQLKLFGSMQTLFSFTQSLITTLANLQVDQVEIVHLAQQKDYELIIGVIQNRKNQEHMRAKINKLGN